MAARKKKVAATEESEAEVAVVIDYSSCRFATDFLLRKNGWKIHDRARGKQEAVWAGPDGELLKKSVALKRLPKVEVSNAEYLEDLYFEEMCR